MSGVETHRKKPVGVEMMLWDGTQRRAEEIRAWVAPLAPMVVEHGGWFVPAPGYSDGDDARLYVAHNRSWSPLPVGYRVAKELDGSGFYPLSPEGFASGYVEPADTEPLPDFDHPHGWSWRDGKPSPSQLHVEPAFKPELGDVFIRIDRAGEHEGIWLPRDVMDEFIAAMRRAADAPEFDGDESGVSE